MPNTLLLRRPLLRREAISTSALEGTHAAFTDLLEADVSDGSSMKPEVREVLNYVQAAEATFASVLEGRPISMGLLERAQAILVKGTKADGSEAGRVRRRPVVIGAEGSPITHARFVPPPADDRLSAGVRAWEEWIHRPRALPAVAQAALAHYQFETLHPFHDGNGRIGRLVVVLQLMHLGEIGDALLEVSPWFEARRSEYQDQLLAVSQTGEFDPWIRFFAEGIGAQAINTVSRIEDLLDVQAEIRQKVRAGGLRGVAAQVAEDLIGRPYLRPAHAARIYGVSYPALNAALKRLESMGVVREVSGRNYDRLFVALDVLEVLQRS